MYTAEGIGTIAGEHRMGHLSCLQRVSRAADGTPIHLRMDGPGFDSMDVPDGANQPKGQFTISPHDVSGTAVKAPYLCNQKTGRVCGKGGVVLLFAQRRLRGSVPVHGELRWPP
jgi:hypothetical protein